MKAVPLHARDRSVRGYALVDDEDFEGLATYPWYMRVDPDGRRYAQRSVKGGTVLMHRQIMGFPSNVVDHRDGDGLNNQRANLRHATLRINAQNRRGADRDNQSGYRGVSRQRGRRRWRAQAMIAGTNHYLGTHDTPELASAAVEAFWAANGPNAVAP